MTKTSSAAGVLEDAVPTTETPRPAAEAATGLCDSCIKAEDCTFIRRPGRAILDCDEFAPVEPRHGAPRLVLARAGLSDVPAENDEEIESAIGLCRSCAHRADCTYPRPQGGVWHCDDYR